MAPSASLLAKLFGAGIAAAVGAGAGVAAATHSSSSLEAKVDQALTRIAAIENDVRFLKCVAANPGDDTAVVRCAALGAKP